MNDPHDLQARLGELLGQIQALPPGDRDRLQRIAEETRARHQRMQQTIKELQDSLDYLRLSVKYLVFDLEATRRENRYLKALLQRDSRDT